MQTIQTWGIAHAIAERSKRFPNDPALSIGRNTWSYKELLKTAADIGSLLPPPNIDNPHPRVAIIVDRDFTSYAAILSALLRGYAYIPLNSEHPDWRNLAVLRKSSPSHIIYSEITSNNMAGIQRLDEGSAQSYSLIQYTPRDRLTSAIRATDDTKPNRLVNADCTAYILFTSGSTGDPKGVPISHGNLTSYLDNASGLLKFDRRDRVSQTFDLTFDLSVHDLLMSWTHGAHLIVASRDDLKKPADFICNKRITRWFSVPSLAHQIRIQGGLTRNSFPHLRTSMFCGEALPISLARDWSIAAPNSSIENWYGPTEATIACSRYVLTQFSDRPNTGSDLVAIGSGFTNMQLSVHDSNLQSVKSGIPGELLLSGPQICTGYLDEPVKTATSFVILPDRTSVAYRTGDRVVQDDQGQIHFLGRIDNQVKIRGYRVELGEIEAILRKASGGLNAVALPWPPNSSSGQVIIGALETGHPQDGPSIISYMSELLPDYMVPVDIISLNSFPKNASGKVDRKLLSNQLQTLHDEKISISAETELNQGEQQLLASIVHVSPHLQPRRILDAPTLIAAGMDSLSFISLTAEIERIYEVELGQDDVVSLSLLPFGQIVGYIESLSKSSRVSDSGSSKRLRGIMERLSNFRVDLGLIKPRSRTIDYRANRILQFVDSFPKLLSSCDKELVIAIGSSGVFRGISPKEIEHEAARLGRPITCINAGFPAINLGSIKLICDYVRQCCEEQNVRVPAILYELDPMHISTLPPRRELRITKDYFSGRIKSDRNAHYGTEFEWSTQHRGEWLYNANASRRKRQPDWERKRDMEVALTYLGNIRFRRTELKQWIAGAELLSRITGRVICFIHPANNAMLQTVETERRGECFDQLLHIIANQHKIEVLPWKSFELDDNDFLDINHVHPMTGRAKLSQQLAHYLFDLKHGY